jgi:hypothetical protein
MQQLLTLQCLPVATGIQGSRCSVGSQANEWPAAQLGTAGDIASESTWAIQRILKPTQSYRDVKHKHLANQFLHSEKETSFLPHQAKA